MKKWRVFTTMIALFFTVACEKPLTDNELLQDDAALSSDESQLRKGEKVDYSDGELALGEKLTNPYSVKNMKTALQNLRKQSDGFKELKIEPNYFYVRVLPTNEEEFNLINSDESVDVFEYPLDYEIKKQGNKYKDKTLGDSNYTWLYCAVPTKKAFDKSLKVEVLEELFLPFGNGKTDEYSRNTESLERSKQSFLEALENEALKITGNLEEVDNRKAKVATWYASGRIRVWDERINSNDAMNQAQQGQGFLPVPGCLVRANRWFTTKTAHTQTNGNFSINHGWPNGKGVNYSIKWDRHDFDIRSGSYGQAYFNGPKQTGGWNLDIQEANTPDNYIYAHVHRGAWTYYYNNTYGIIEPPTRTFFDLYGVFNLVGQKMHLGAKQGGGRSHYFQFNGNWLASEVKLIFDLDGSPGIPEDDGRAIFGTTIHELTHAAHWKIGMTYSLYCSPIGGGGRLAESWAEAVGWHVTREVYTPTVDPMNDFDNRQRMTLAAIQANSTCLSNSSWYTPLFIDLMDNFNQSLTPFNNLPNDGAANYNIVDLQNYLIARPVNWHLYRSFLEANSANPTEAAAVQLFNDYD
jgi:hypothetical protein